MAKKIKLFDPSVGTKEQQVTQQVLKSHFWASGAGIGHVKKFEDSFRKFIDSDNCVAVNSGTAALNLALSLIDLKGKEVIVPSLTFVATVNAILLNGGKPVFADVKHDTMCIDPHHIEKLITKKTKVILPVHYAGMPCDLDKIQQMCKKNDLILIEDAAHASGAKFMGKRIGSHGDIVCFSFHPVKNLAMPTGGLIAINSEHRKMRDVLLARRWCGITNRNNFEYDVKEVGWNYYMNEISAAIGLVQLKKLDAMNRTRRQIAKRYSKEINLERKMPFDENCSYHLYWLMVKNRKKFMEKMFNAGIETGIHYRPVHTMSLYKKNISLPITETAGKGIVSIPIHQNLSDAEVDRIIRTVNQNV
ncbi:DegT/DnrJ/EryC1/StrS family aminotransferase [Nitrosarchaeum koreense]|uniref:Glutamine--scyllo-inositol transaminase n=1 Tax=Nitrosarchaeum koreense MY1 TaxID=1001994 RepID=F9CYB0_9ARCH|nr:DegT/DnrJ/EryC1/StrS family aminotransferase [Nitrosarchaeum koreense]EGP92888.1 Glutamine--scyllo-inositol transaminase [Nitrosarchaeum koreense MY1]